MCVCVSVHLCVCVCVLIWHINQSTRRVGKSKSRPSFDMSSKVSPRTHTRLMLPVRNPVPHFAIAIQIFPSDCNCRRLTDCQTDSWQLAALATHKLPVGVFAFRSQVTWLAPCHFHFDSDLILMDMSDANNNNNNGTTSTARRATRKTCLALYILLSLTKQILQHYSFNQIEGYS